MLEAYQHGDNAFVTLTYEDNNQVELDPKHLQDFLKRLRKHVYPRRIRYFAVGEYGDTTGRPHYHLALFGFPTCQWHQTQPNRKGSCCTACDTVRDVWGHGLIQLARLEPASSRYIAGYVVKKMTNEDDERLEGRYPEFARMSLRPGIGASAMDEVASSLLTHAPDLPDVPSVLQHGRAKLPLGRYLRRELRKKMGRSPEAPESTIKAIEEKLQPLRQIAESYAPRGFKEFAFREEIIRQGTGKRINLEARMRRNRKRGTI